MKKFLVWGLGIYLLLSLTLVAPAQNYGNQPKEGTGFDASFYQPPADKSPLPLSKQTKVKNIIFMIGDGMSFAHVDSARIKAMGADGRLYMERMPVTGLVKTHSANALVTDSAAGGTALATGFKTKNGTIGLAADGSKVESTLELAQKKGKSTGLVATSTISHATPASFSAHTKSRNSEEEIAVQLANSDINVLFGGGKHFFIPKSAEKSKRKDEINPLEIAIANGYKFVETKKDFIEVQGNKILGLFQMSSLKTTGDEPTLSELTTKTIELLKGNKDGFFMMVEGSQIDWGAHENNPDYMIRQTLLFDMAIKAALDFAAKDGETLVIVTADHETGGLAIKSGNLDGSGLELVWGSKGHSALQVPVYAFGPRAEMFMGVQDNTDVANKVKTILNE
ncbi:MAG TPA: alkaline phosphatase [Candidatus Sumerlaeota bacterium]|nr:MAG: Alkaline phosphatase 4 precursor [candidate division BRC1 bacterium ADurb.Bin183]HOE62729.1 alkaline phosphatase [Candidatus Sumerlaeota bacterium]HRR29743.1 alkaline phosphatase [Candidatus Sumerlaeia bacterium]HON50411.1 alkaline phosphatase [Candidatus Sumerlaeota bacterium]HOR63627.1 alkaline phosphatase [Candidatus Sumerlaeota bacterium]